MIETTRYELPPEGITLLGYIIRRMHKTEWLAKIPDLVSKGQISKALEYLAIYAASSAVSFGRAFYQPQFNRVGEVISEADPATGAVVTARLESRSPHYVISSEARMLNGNSFRGKETITGTTIGLRGLGMPAPSKYTFTSGDYSAEFTGTLTSELALALFKSTRIRAYGFLDLKDNFGNSGRLELHRSGDMIIHINDQPAIHHSIPKITWMTIQHPAPQPA